MLSCARECLVLASVLPLLLAGLCCHTPVEAVLLVSQEFHKPRQVVIEGYGGDAMEPFLSRDGTYLFFNNLNEAPTNTDLFWAERASGAQGTDGLHFIFRGPVGGVNTTALEGVASMDRNGVFYFISPRSYDQTASTIYQGQFSGGSVTGIGLAPGISLKKPGRVNFDAEISSDGQSLYFVDSQFGASGGPKWARILVAHKTGGTFVRDETSVSASLRTLNDEGMNYAPATSADEKTIYWTRALPDTMPSIYVASRADKSQSFGPAAQIGSINGFAEGPTVSPDGKTVYFHLKVGSRFVIECVERK